MSSLPLSEWAKLYFGPTHAPDRWQERLLDEFSAGRRRVFVGVDWGREPSRSVWYTPPAPSRFEAHVGGRRAGKTAEAERRAGILRLEELEPGVWGLRR